jgi:hypothetical protein
MSSDDLETWVQDLCGEDVPIKKIDSGMISDDSAFVSVGNILACKSHAYCNADFVKIPDFSLDSKFFKPYANFSQSLMIRDQKLNSLPNDLLTIFNNLTVPPQRSCTHVSRSSGAVWYDKPPCCVA